MSIEWENRNGFINVYVKIANQRRIEITLWYRRWRRHAFGWGRLPGMREGSRYWELGQVDVYYYAARPR